MRVSPLLLPLGVLLFLVNAPDQPQGEPLPISTGINQSLRVAVGPPDATLPVWTLEPKVGIPIKGTVLFLHGFLANHLQLENAARALRDAGYRAVLLDLRGFGRSTPAGADITFRALDARDLSQVVDALQARKLCGRTVGVYGTSMGAAAAILFAGHDLRVKAVVSVASFADIGDEVMPFSRNALGGLAPLLSDSDITALANAVGGATHMDLDDARPIEAIAQTQAPILLIHGDADAIVPYGDAVRLHAAAPDHRRLETRHGSGHVELCLDLPGELQKMTREWFDEYLKP